MPAHTCQRTHSAGPEVPGHRGLGRLRAKLTLPLDGERTVVVRSDPSGSATRTGPHAQGRVAVPSTLPNGIERTEAVRPGPSGSATHMELHAQGRVAVPPTWNCTLRAEWQCISHCHSTSSVRTARPHTATRRRAYRNGALRPEWQCRPCGVARSGPSGSATHMELHAQGRVAVPSTLPNGIERTETVRPGPSGSAIHTGLYAQGRVAVHLTLPLDGERAI